MAFGGEGGPDPSKFDFLVGDDFGVWQNKTMESSSIVVEQSGIPGCAQIPLISLVLKGVHSRALDHPQLEVDLPVLMLSCPPAVNRTVSACVDSYSLGVFWELSAVSMSLSPTCRGHKSC